MSDDWSTEGARDAADRGELGSWVAEFLASPGSDNAALGELLTQTHRCWTGPVQLPLDRLQRLAGPPGEPVLEVVDDDFWRDDVEDLAAKVEDGFRPPPVVVTYEGGQLTVEDGNHRIEAIRRAGRHLAWAVVGCEDAAALDRFLATADRLTT